jgi:hypothetical protein
MRERVRILHLDSLSISLSVVPNKSLYTFGLVSFSASNLDSPNSVLMHTLWMSGEVKNTIFRRAY